jgi:crotonobetainyl-CoA:carnitine CoA-transferase CaiB-like acyl-CoA transferase
MPSSILPDEAGNAPLAGITVLDLTRVLSGPYCTMLLGDMGARVIKIEQPGRGDDTRAWGPPFVAGESAYFLSVNRNKESVAIDFKTAAGRELLTTLASRADIVVENFRPGTLARVGLDYGTLGPKHPGLVYVSISGFGQTGPRSAEPGYDSVIQAEGGLMSVTGPAGGSAYRLGVAVADLVTGMFAMQGILLALLVRVRTGRGQHVDVAMLDATAALLTYQASIYFTTGEAQRRMGNRHPSIAPYDTFEAADGEFVIAVGHDAQFVRLCELSGLESLAADARFMTNAGRVQHYDALRSALANALRQRTRHEWITALTRAGVPAGSVRDVGEVLRDPQLLHRAMVETVDHAIAGTIAQLGIPVKMSGSPGSIRRPPPTLGQHTGEVLSKDLGLDPRAIEALAASGAVGLPV